MMVKWQCLLKTALPSYCPFAIDFGINFVDKSSNTLSFMSFGRG